jgi:hypothetical protein
LAGFGGLGAFEGLRTFGALAVFDGFGGLAALS